MKAALALSLTIIGTTAVSDTVLAHQLINVMPCAEATQFDDFTSLAELTPEVSARLEILVAFYEKVAQRLGISVDQAAMEVGMTCYASPDKPLADLTFN